MIAPFLLTAALLHAEPAVAAPGSEGKHDVVGAVMDHVTNSRTIEFQMPWPFDQRFEWTPPEWKLNVGAQVIDVSITKHLFWLWIGALLMFLFFFVAARRAQSEEVPKGLGAVAEGIVEFARETAITSIGEHDADRYVPYLATVFCFVLFSGLLGVIPYASTPTSNINVTLALALCTFSLTLIAGMRAQGVVGYWTHLVPSGVPWVLYPVMLIVEALGIFTKPFALTVRLFANMNAGHIVILVLLGLIFIGGSPFIAGISVPAALLIYGLELLIIYIQAYIFMLLSATFIGLVMHSH